MKKFTAVFASVLMLTVAALCFAGCGGDSGETFPGKLSEKTYNTVDTAAAAFLEDELAAEDVSLSFISYTRTGEISAAEMKKFDLGGVKAENISSKEWGKIIYNAKKGSAGSLATQPGETMEVTVGMFKIGDAYRYFVPVAKTDEMISKSYFESVFDATKYKNCTTTYEMHFDCTISSGTESMNATVDMGITLKISETAAMLEARLGSGMSLSGEEQAPQDITYTVYLVRDGTSFVAYSEREGVWTQVPFSGASSWDDLYGIQLKDFLDHSYFKKTPTGFHLTSFKFEEFVTNYIVSSNYSSLALSFDFGGSSSFQGGASYDVADGRLSKASINVGAAYLEKGGNFVDVSVTAANKFYDFGTTSVELPAEIYTKAD